MVKTLMTLMLGNSKLQSCQPRKNFPIKLLANYMYRTLFYFENLGCFLSTDSTLTRALTLVLFLLVSLEQFQSSMLVKTIRLTALLAAILATALQSRSRPV